MSSLSPPQIAAIGLGMMAKDHMLRAPTAGGADDIKAECDRAHVLIGKSRGLLDGSLSYIPILDPDLKAGYDRAVKEILG